MGTAIETKIRSSSRRVSTGVTASEVPATHLLHTATHCNNHSDRNRSSCDILRHPATHCNSLQQRQQLQLQHDCDIGFYNTLRHTATNCDTLQQRQRLQQKFRDCNSDRGSCITLQHTASGCNNDSDRDCNTTATNYFCNTLRHTSTHCDKLQHSATKTATATGVSATHCDTL